MNAIQLQKPDGTPVHQWMCECGSFSYIEAIAQQCCICSHCNQPFKDKRTPFHAQCWQEKDAQTKAENLASATKLDSWDGWVFWDGHGHREGYFSSLDDLREFARLYEEPLPEFVFVCEAEPFPGLHLESVLENLTSEMFDEARDYLIGTEELERAIVAFNDANTSNITFVPDYTRAVRVS